MTTPATIDARWFSSKTLPLKKNECSLPPEWTRSEHPTSTRLVSVDVQVMLLASRTMFRLASMKARNFRTKSHSQCHLVI